MKKITKAILMAALGLAIVPAAKADSQYDLLVGFTQQGNNSSGNDLLYNLGFATSVGPFTGIYNGETWDLSSALSGQGFDVTQVQWGVIGDANSAVNGANPELTWVTTPGTPGSTPPTITGDSNFQSVQAGVNSLETDFGANGQFSWAPAGALATPDATGDNSWNQQTINGGSYLQIINSYGVNPNATGLTSSTLWQVADDGSNPTDLGTFTLSGEGVLTFNAVPEPGTIGLLSVGGLLVLAWRNRLTRKNA